MEKPKLKYEDGKLKASASVGLDTDKDGVNAVAASLVVEIDAKEAVSEIVKDKVPEWLKELLNGKI